MLWLWCRLAATAPIRPLAWEPLCATGAALKRQKKNKRKQPAALFKIMATEEAILIGAKRLAKKF